jgi:hypothetical protein
MYRYLGPESSPALPRGPLHPLRCVPALLAAVALASGCGESRAAPPPAPPPVLPARAVSYLPSRSRTLTAADLVHAAPGPMLSRSLARWGYVVGSERTFQGQSHLLQVVVSRTLQFRTATGAAAYVRYVHRNARAVFGAPPTGRPLETNSRRGWLFTLAPCACHMATPVLVAVASSGPRVSWLEVNGPDANVRSLTALLRLAP